MSELKSLIHAPVMPGPPQLEFTSRRNCRSFCTAEPPRLRWKGRVEKTVSSVKALLSEGQPESVSISGHGETTIFPDWERHAAELLTLA